MAQTFPLRSAASDARTGVSAIEDLAGVTSSVAMAGAQWSARRRHCGARDAADYRANGAADEGAANDAGGRSRRLLRRRAGGQRGASQRDNSKFFHDLVLLS